MTKLRTKILAILIPIIIVSLLASSGIVYEISKAKVKEHIIRQNETQSQLLANETGLWLGKFYTLVDMNSKTDYKISLTNSDRIDMMSEMMKIDSAITDIYIGYTDGVMLDGSGWDPPATYDPRERPWYKAAQDSMKTTYGDPYLDLVTNKMVTSVGAPVLDANGKFTGVLSADVQLDVISNKINEVKVGENGYAFIMTNGGIIVAHPIEDMISKMALRILMMILRS